MAADPADTGEIDYRPFNFVLTLMSATLMIMPARRVVIEVVDSGLWDLLVPVLVLVGLPPLGALAGTFTRFSGRGGRLFGIMLGVFVAALLLMVLLAFWFIYSVLNSHR
ncbi:hypothetical protein [Streptosporangium sp. NPDC051022]|uniref:hypothetical protein n=1 Tax=Streptosporangium sp. NPDC051022 TaxID=3155752 RepID=UPI00341CF861